MIDVMVITFNESLNLPYCLAALRGWTNRIFVIDSGSTDGTPDIARAWGAEVVHHDWEGYARQKNWGLDNLPFESDWLLIVDADEVITEGVRKRLLEIAAKPLDMVEENGFFINRLTYFMDKPIRHCGYFPSWNMRFFKRGTGRYEDREVHEHIVIDNPVGFIREAMMHYDRRGLEHYVAKHNRYSTLEARALYSEITGENTSRSDANVSRETRQRRWLKRYVMPVVPFPGLFRFLYVYVVRLGVLDGRVGLEFCKFISIYDSLVAMKLRALKRQAKLGREVGDHRVRGLATAEGDDPVLTESMRRTPTPDGTSPAGACDVRVKTSPPARPLPPDDPDPDSPADRFGDRVQPGERVIVTGGSGFIGTNVVEYYWRSGAEVLNIDFAPPRNPAHQGLWTNVDILDRAALEQAVHEFKPDVFLHLAARTDLEETKDIMGYAANVQGVENVCRVLEDVESLKRIIMTSTQLVCRPEYQPRSDTDYAPHTLYGMSKVATEAVTRGWRKAPCPWTIVRPTSIWGPWFHVPYKTFFTAIARRMYFHQRGFDPLRSFGFAWNCVYQYVTLTRAREEDVAEKTFYMSDHEPVRVREWADLIQQEMGVKPLREVSYSTLRVAAKVGDLLFKLGMPNPPMTTFRLKNLTSDNINDLGPMAAVVGDLPYSLEEGVRVTVDWLREHEDLNLPPRRKRPVDAVQRNAAPATVEA